MSNWALLQRQRERATLCYFINTRHGWKINKEPERTIWVTSPLPFRKLFQMFHPSVTECSYAFPKTENHLIQHSQSVCYVPPLLKLHQIQSKTLLQEHPKFFSFSLFLPIDIQSQNVTIVTYTYRIFAPLALKMNC